MKDNKLHTEGLRFKVSNLDYDKRYYEANKNAFNDLVISNFLTENLSYK